MFKVTIRPTDTLFSLYIRTRDNHTCQRCGTQYTPPYGMSLQNSHFWGRKAESTRFDPENCDALCAGCHQYFEQNPQLCTEWKKKRLGEERYNALTVRNATHKKRDDKLDMIVIKELLKTL